MKSQQAAGAVADVVIVGAGPVGGALALLLARSGLDVQLLEARSGAANNARTLALSHGTRLILEQAGVWQDALPVTPITAIHISHKGAFGRSVLSATDAGVPALGYVLSYTALQQALDERMAAAGVRVHRGALVEAIVSGESAVQANYQQEGEARALQSRLIVLADGGANIEKVPGLVVNEKDYGQTALVAAVTLDQPHGGMAYERFTPTGPAALLPNGDARGCEYSLVWTAAPDEAERLLQLDDSTFLLELDAHFGRRAGRFLAVGKRASFPLKLKHVTPRVAPRVAVIGAAAQTLHPVAGQGFNIGVRDAADLAQLLGSDAGGDSGAAALLERFAKARRSDTRMGIGFTDSLVGLFSTDHPLLRAGRGAGLALLDILPPARRILAEKMIYGA